MYLNPYKDTSKVCKYPKTLIETLQMYLNPYKDTSKVCNPYSNKSHNYIIINVYNYKIF